MTAIRHTLQREVFQPSDESLLAVVHVSKLLKKKKLSFLCIASSTEKPISIIIYQVKKTDKNVYKKKRSWNLSELKAVNGKNVSKDTHEFDLHLDKIYKWFAINLQERQNFLIVLCKQCHKYLLKEKPAFHNLPEEWTEDAGHMVEIEVAATPGAVDAVETEEYLALNEREEQDLERLMSQCELGVSNAEAFMEILAKDLSVLDGANVHSVLASEQQVGQLTQQIEAAIAEAGRLEGRLDSYDEVLCHIRDTMEKMEEKNLLIEVASRNNSKLLGELQAVVAQLDLPQAQQAALAEADLASARGLADAVAAGAALLAAAGAQVHPALERMAAVREQRRRLDKWRAKFSQTVSRHLNNLFIHLGNDAGDALGFHSQELTLPRHTSVHRELQPYAELMRWCKAMDYKAYTALSRVYTSSLGKLYEREVRRFFELARQQVSGSRDRRVRTSGSNQDLAGKQKTPGQGKAPPAPALLGEEREQWGEADPAERQRFDEVLERALAELEPVCLAEQDFCVGFFQLDVRGPGGKAILDGPSPPGSDELDATSPVSVLPLKKMEKQINGEVRRMMGELFSCLRPELLAFVAFYEKTDSFMCMSVLVRLRQHVMSAQDTGSFLSTTFGSVLVEVKRNFDTYMQSQLASVEEARASRKGRCGILPYVANFEDFASTAESIFRNPEHRTDLDKWYPKLMAAIFEAVPRNAAEHKGPEEVIKMENFHHLFAVLSQLKIPALEKWRKEAKQKYSEALKAYVTQYFGRPLEKLNLFFEGVQARVAQGVKESEISYQMAYSKQELRKVIQQYPAREVKKGLDSLHRKVDKHLCPEENLNQVVWHAMQEEFITQYKCIEELIQRCYPGSMITLDFSIQQILEFFSEIARTHN
ncbi:exocyst complex component 1 [Bacillus rossius redtenbacheri]|uniref:exocyst complex component 1 n=1 Tax=Bacillus rossius redtenbacheri TaxID=93214 RepID=UPI002FDDE931